MKKKLAVCAIVVKTFKATMQIPLFLFVIFSANLICAEETEEIGELKPKRRCKVSFWFEFVVNTFFGRFPGPEPFLQMTLKTSRSVTLKGLFYNSLLNSKKGLEQQVKKFICGRA